MGWLELGTMERILNQPGPHERAIQCFIKRNKDTNTYFLYLGLSSTSLLVEHSKFLLVARKCRRLSSIDYIISLDADDISIESSAYVGKVRSNFMGTKFKVYDVHAPYAGHMIPSSRAFKRLISNRQVCPKAPLVVHEVVYVVYQLNVFGSRGPRRMLCTLHSIPASMMEVGCENQLSVETSTEDDSAFQCRMPKACKPNIESLKLGAVNSVSLPLILKNKAPRWHEQLQCWCLNFRGRVTVASVKNFQLVASFDTSNPSMLHHEQEKVILQFGKIGKDVYTMDYRYPLSAFEAFAMCLTSFGTKLGCE
ncbi:hypothetical protein KP509_16G035900 [Ceratopteris richardii]|uniref:Tubby C-terminal domain-containing protein n=1 Tax=Ceratopteris richardii TaxID=49495 RepID=A0A8T2SZD2_CERRI|nr:hypothetical protein KP509_16G035900 [Ceratopteris richardii]